MFLNINIMVKIGDTVRFLSSTGGGRVVKIDGQVAHVEEDDGFVTPVLVKELVVVAPAGDEKARRDIFGGTGQQRQADEAEARSKFVPTAVPEAPKPEPVVETPGGDRLNVVLAYEAVELKHLSTTSFEAYLVNDSNYYLYFTYLSRADDEEGWTTRYAGLVEPNMQIFIEELTREQVGRLDRVAFQYVAFKRDRQFTLKAPVAVESRLDTTKFFKLHCFRENVYFDRPVITVEIVKDDIPQRTKLFNSVGLEEAMRSKVRADRRPVLKRQAPTPKADAPLVVDLHIGELLDTTAGMSTADILNYQIDTFRRVMDENLRNRGRKIVFIHGKGEGILRQAIMKELNHRYKSTDVQNASFREYGYGATQVTIR